MYFPSKKDLWLGIAFCFGALIPLSINIWKPTVYGWFLSFSFIIFVCWVWFKTGYTISDKELLVQQGPFHWKIPLESIKKVRRSNEFVSSPALSLDRLEITYSNGKSILISPDKIDAFLNILRERCPLADIK